MQEAWVQMHVNRITSRFNTEEKVEQLTAPNQYGGGILVDLHALGTQALADATDCKDNLIVLIEALTRYRRMDDSF